MNTPTKARKQSRIPAGLGNSHRHGAESGRRSQPTDRRPHLLDDTDPDLPALPPADEQGLFPAIETARVIIARQIIRGRKIAGWTQAELARRAGVRQETISRIETGKHSPGLKTMAKIERALKKAGA